MTPRRYARLSSAALLAVGLLLASRATTDAQPPSGHPQPGNRPASSPPAATAHDEHDWIRNIRQVTRPAMGFARAGEAYFSADGKRICFQAYPTGKTDYQIYVMNTDGSDLQMVSTGRGATTCSYFHPSGRKLLFAANHHDPREPEQVGEVEEMRPRGGAHPKPTHDQPPHGQNAGHQKHPGSSHGQASGGGHGQSSGGRHGGGSRGYAWMYYPGMDLFQYDFQSEKLIRLTTADGYDAEGSYSPDGTKIVFSSFRDNDQEIYICDADGSNPRRITHAPGKDGGPFFSPDGKRICYRSDRDGSGNLQIFTNNLEGTNEKALTTNEQFNWCPFWHPSGEWLVFTRADFRRRPNFDLYLVKADGSETHRVTSNQVFDGLPVFSPDGKYLMWTSRRNGEEAPQIFMADFVGLSPDGRLAPWNRRN
jgi:TolB protein